MRTKAIRDLAQKSDDDFFAEVAAGLDYMAQNATALEGEARPFRGSACSIKAPRFS